MGAGFLTGACPSMTFSHITSATFRVGKPMEAMTSNGPGALRTVFGRPTGRPYVKTAAEALAGSLRNLGTGGDDDLPGQTLAYFLFPQDASGTDPVKVCNNRIR